MIWATVSSTPCFCLLLYRASGEGNGNPIQYSCLENPMDGGAWWAAVHGVATSGMTEWLHFHFSLSCIGEGNDNPLQCSCLENPRDGGPCWAAIYGVAQSRKRLKWLSSSSSYRASPPSAAKNIINLISVLTIWWCPWVESSHVLLEKGVCYDQWVLLGKLC